MIIVTGARGFLGRYLVKELSKLSKPLSLTTSDKKISGKVGGYPLSYLNLEDVNSFQGLPEAIETVIHLAVVIPQKNKVITFSKYMAVNAEGVKKLIEEVAKRGCKRFIYASTQMVIERPMYLPVDENHPLVPVSDYGLSKAVGERYLLSLAQALGMRAIVLRFARIYGAGQNPGYVLTEFIERAKRGLPLIIHGKGKLLRDLIYVKDAVGALLCALGAETSGIYNIGSGKGVSIKELAETILSVFSKKASPLEYKDDIKEEGCNFYLDITKAKTELKFSPRYGLKEALLDYKSELAKEGS